MTVLFSGLAVMNAAPGRADLRPRERDLFPPPKAVCSAEPLLLLASCTRIPVRCTQVHSEGEEQVGPQIENHVCLAPPQCLQHDREVLEM